LGLGIVPSESCESVHFSNEKHEDVKEVKEANKVCGKVQVADAGLEKSVAIPFYLHRIHLIRFTLTLVEFGT
jgi:hypothetical protein